MKHLILVIIIFSLGWLSNDLVSDFNLERPSTITGQTVLAYGIDRPSPSDIIPESKIHVLSDRIIIEVDNPQWARFTNTKSMDPVLDVGANALQIVPTSTEQIHVGDIISFKTRSGVIIHRVIEIGEDEDGWYAITKGDNNPFPDPGKVRFKDVTKLLFGVIY
ncbi:MAG: signal peptidase I [Candidatus Woesearchaeota archaeon]